ncbi:MAG: transglutaminase domain-containing protein [Elusimicrobia bacterium]|nr:transglutaminase domain-containing protein [Elusimicrobiota bacterium]
MTPARWLAVFVGVYLFWAVPASQLTPLKDFRQVDWVEVVRVGPVSKAGRLRIWMPVPLERPYQRLESLELQAPVPYRPTAEPEFGNRMVYLDLATPLPRQMEIRLRARVSIRERGTVPADLAGRERRLYLEPRGLAVVDATVRSIAKNLLGGAGDVLEKGRHLYGYVFDHMEYDKSVPGWGRGDVRRACAVGKGNCTDFHSLFLSLAQAGGIPARFLMGVPLTRELRGDLGPAYHCWAEFYAEERGWVPVDVSEARKNSERKNYYFGRLDPNRILLTQGREILLEPPQRGRRLNFFIYPYLELNGESFEDFELERNYEEVRNHV